MWRGAYSRGRIPAGGGGGGGGGGGSAPLILATDIVAGPITGGENGNGIFVNLYGVNFGASGLGTTTKVYAQYSGTWYEVAG